MTDPDVLGNIANAKFITGDPEIVNLWRPSAASGDLAMHHPSDSTTNGVDYVCPASRIFWFLKFYISEGSDEDIEIQKDTSPDTTDGTTLCKLYHVVPITTTTVQEYDIGSCKFVAGEYVNINQVGGGSMFVWGWGVECDA